MTASSSVTWTWSLWMTAICIVVVTSPATLPSPWTSLASGETYLAKHRTYPPPLHPDPQFRLQCLPSLWPLARILLCNVALPWVLGTRSPHAPSVITHLGVPS